MSVFYFGSYVDDEQESLYEASVPGSIKMHYILTKIQEATSKQVNICSFAKNKKKAFYLNKTFHKPDNRNVLYFMGCGINNKIGRALDWFLKRLAFLLVIRCVKDQDTVIIYHSGWTKYLKHICKKRKFRKILEVEEIYAYSDFIDKNVQSEIESIKGFDSYIYINEYIPNSLNIKKPYAVSYGVVKRNMLKNEDKDFFDDGKIHIVYAGAISLERQGAYTALDAVKELSDDYVLHILGTGTNEAIKQLKNNIENVNSLNNTCKVEYNGFLHGDDMYNFLKKCDIGLSTYNLRSNFSNNSLPSKVLSYMSCGLNVVIGYTEAFEIMPISQYWTFYYEQSPENIASAIRNVRKINRNEMYQSLIEADNNVALFLKNELN